MLPLRLRTKLLQRHLDLRFQSPEKLRKIALGIDKKELNRIPSPRRDDHAGAPELGRIAIDTLCHGAEAIAVPAWCGLDQGFAVHLGITFPTLAALRDALANKGIGELDVLSVIVIPVVSVYDVSSLMVHITASSSAVKPSER